MPDVWTEDLTQIINACMQVVASKSECPVCHIGDVVNKMQKIEHQTITTYNPCSNEKCPSFLPSKEEAKIKKALASLTPKQRVAYFMLQKTVDALYETGVDVSYFPHQAQIVLINAAKDIAVAVEYADNAII